MRKPFNFIDAFGLATESDVPNGQELQEEIKEVIDSKEGDLPNIVDDQTELYVVGNTEKASGDVDYVDEQLKAEIKAIEAVADPDAQIGARMAKNPEDPYNETLGGTEFDKEEVEGIEKVKEYSENIDVTDVTGTAPNMDEFLREDKGQEERTADDGITGPGDNETELNPDSVTLNDLSGPGSELNAEHAGDNDGPGAGEPIEVEPGTVTSGEEDESNLTNVGTESDNAVEQDTEEDKIETEELEEENEGEDGEKEPEEAPEEKPSNEPVPEEPTSDPEPDNGDGDDYEITGDETKEEQQIIADIKVTIDPDIPGLSGEELQKVEEIASNVQMAQTDAFQEVEEMGDVNPPNGEPETVEGEEQKFVKETAVMDDENLMSDIIAKKAAETSHGVSGDDEGEDGVFEGDIPDDGNVDGQISEGQGSYEEKLDGTEDLGGDYEGDGNSDTSDDLPPADPEGDNADFDGDGDIDSDDAEKIVEDEQLKAEVKGDKEEEIEFNLDEEIE